MTPLMPQHRPYRPRRPSSTYNICLSSKELSENLIVDYSFNVGDGLKAGVDFERVTTGNQIVFVPGVYSMPIRIRWLPNEIDPLKDNTITIRIENTSLGFTVGFPVPTNCRGSTRYEK